MARARNIKPGFYKNEDLAECSLTARFIFPGLWMLADREGRLEDRPKRIKGELLPFDAVHVEPLLCELANYGFITRYQADGKRYIAVCKFGAHQKPHVREQNSVIPPPPRLVESTAKVMPGHDHGIGEPALNPSCLNPSCLNPSSLNPESLKNKAGKTKTVAKATAKQPYASDFEDVWAAYPIRPGASKRDAFFAWQARLKAGATVIELLHGVHRYANYVHVEHTDPRFIKQPATFFGPGEFYACDWTPSDTPVGETLKERSRREAVEVLTGRKRKCETEMMPVRAPPFTLTSAGVEDAPWEPL